MKVSYTEFIFSTHSALKSLIKDPTLRIDGCAVNYYLVLAFCAIGGFYNILI